MLKKKLEVKDIRVTGVQLSGDGENWQSEREALAATGGGIAHLVDLLTNEERVFIRCQYVDIFSNGTNGLPKTGATYELKLLEVAPLRRVIEGEVASQAKQIAEASE